MTIVIYKALKPRYLLYWRFLNLDLLIIIDYRSRKKIGGEGGSWVFVIPFGIKSQLIVGHEKKLTFEGSGFKHLQGEGFLRIMRHPLNQNWEWLSAKKLEKMLDIICAYWEKNSTFGAGAIFWDLNHTLGHRPNKSKNWLILWACLKRKQWVLGGHLIICLF